MRNVLGDLSADAHALLDQRAKAGNAGIIGQPLVSSTGRIPIARDATWLVLLDGVPYAGYGSKGDAVEAMTAWRHGWDGAVGRSLEVVPRRRSS